MNVPTRGPAVIPHSASQNPNTDDGNKVSGKISRRKIIAANSHIRSPHAAKKYEVYKNLAIAGGDSLSVAVFGGAVVAAGATAAGDA